MSEPTTEMSVDQRLKVLEQLVAELTAQQAMTESRTAALEPAYEELRQTVTEQYHTISGKLDRIENALSNQRIDLQHAAAPASPGLTLWEKLNRRHNYLTGETYDDGKGKRTRG